MTASEAEKKFGDSERLKRIDEPTAKQAPKPFPYYPPQPTEREITRMELMMQLNMWDNNNQAIARRHAETFIELLKEQFPEEAKPSK